VEWVDPGEIQLPKPMRLYDPDQVLRQRWEPFVGRELAGALDTIKPSGISEINPMEFVWHVDVAIDGIRLPPRSCLNQLMAVLGETERESVRASSDGISYFSREPFFIPAGVTVEQMMCRPRLRLPDATEIFKKLLEAGGLRGVVSQAGRYTQGVLDLWGVGRSCWLRVGSQGQLASGVAGGLSQEVPERSGPWCIPGRPPSAIPLPMGCSASYGDDDRGGSRAARRIPPARDPISRVLPQMPSLQLRQLVSGRRSGTDLCVCAMSRSVVGHPTCLAEAEGRAALVLPA
jgi:hypothetical protein